EQSARLVDESGFEHRCATCIDALIQRVPLRLQAKTQDAKPCQRIATFVPHHCEPFSSQQADLDGTNQFRRVIWMNPGRSLRIQSGEDSMQMFNRPLIGAAS